MVFDLEKPRKRTILEYSLKSLLMEIIDPVSNTPETSTGSYTSPVSTPYATPSTPTPQANQNQVISVGEWFLILLVITIPLVNLIVLIIWAFGGSSNLNKVNFAKANLIWLAILIVLCTVFFSSLMAIMMALR